MKASASILSFLFIVLFIQPAFMNWNNNANVNTGLNCSNSKAGKTGCCKAAGSKAKTQSAKKPVKQQTNNPCDNCNPFMPCNTCPYVPEELQVLVSPSIDNTIENSNEVNDLDLSDYNAESWHPPELFSHL